VGRRARARPAPAAGVAAALKRPAVRKAERRRSQLRITFVTDNLERFGGIKVKVALANGLVRRGHHVSLVVPKDNYEQRKYDELLPDIYHSIETAPPADFIVGSYFLTIWKIKDFGVSKGRPIHLVQGDEPVHWSDHPISRRAFTHPLFKRIIISDYQYSFAEKYNQVIIGKIHNGVDSALFHPGPPESRRRTRICFINREGPNKGVADVVAALRLVFAARRDIDVVSFGFSKGPPVPPGGLLARLMHKGLEVHYECQPSPERIADIYCTSRIYTCASLSEGSPLPPLEAMASGTAVVTTKAGIDYGQDGENLLFCDDHDPPHMADKILQVLNDDALFARLSENGLKTARGRTWERMVEEFEGVLLQELDKPAETGAAREQGTQLEADLWRYILALEDVVGRCEAEMNRITSRRLYRWGEALALALRRLPGLRRPTA